jgi:hypothetical protein
MQHDLSLALKPKQTVRRAKRSQQQAVEKRKRGSQYQAKTGEKAQLTSCK